MLIKLFFMAMPAARAFGTRSLRGTQTDSSITIAATYFLLLIASLLIALQRF